NPGISRSKLVRAASGVTSRGPTPVPPVVKIAATCPPSASVASRSAISEITSGMVSMTATLQPICSSRSRTAGPERSTRVPALTESLIVRTAALIMLPLAAEISALSSGLFQQVQILDFDRLIQRFGHVVHRQSGDGGGCQRFHFYSGLPRGGGGRDAAHALFLWR